MYVPLFFSVIAITESCFYVSQEELIAVKLGTMLSEYPELFLEYQFIRLGVYDD